MNRMTAVTSALVLLAFAAGCAAAVTVAPATPPQMAVVVSGGQVELPGGKTVAVKETRLTFDPPEKRDLSLDTKAPGNYASHFDSWQPWPGKYSGKTLAITVKPRDDEEGTQMLGGLFRQLVSCKVASADGSKTFVAGQDYLVNDDWGQIANKDNRLGTPDEAPLKITYTVNLQRLDLVQVAPDGTVSVKKGASRFVCPQLPEPDAGCAAVAGIYVAPWRLAVNPHLVPPGAAKPGINKAQSDYAVTKDEIFVIHPAPPVAPINGAALAATVKKLKDGGEARIAFIGDSITLGAEAPMWWANLWTEKNLGYPSRVIVALRKEFPKATVTPIAAFKGGTQTKYGLQMIDEVVAPAKPDLVVIAFGGNDAAGPVGKGPNNPPEQYKEDIRKMVKRAKELKADVLLVALMQLTPFGQPNVAERLPAYRQALLDLAKEENVAVADVYTEWLNQATRGTPPFSQLHNCVNHPGKEGHKVYADVILRFFE